MKMNSFEGKYSELMESIIDLEIKDSTLHMTYKRRSGSIDMETIPFDQYIMDVERVNSRMKLTIKSVFIAGKINGFVEDDTLYLDETFPFKDQMNELEKIKKYFFMPYKYVFYRGELSFMDKLLLKGKLKTLNNLSDNNKTDSILINLKLQLSKLDYRLKSYVEERINQIYAKPEEKLKSYVDLTIPIESLDVLNVNDQLENLNNQMPVLVQASGYIKRLTSTSKPKIVEGTEGIEPEMLDALSKQIDKDYQEHFDIVRNNAIAEIEGKEHRDLEELGSEFTEKIQSTYELLREYYTNNSSIFEKLYNSDDNNNLIVARINSIYTFYTSNNPHTNKIQSFNRRMKTAIDKRENLQEIADEYSKYLKQALIESENFAFDSIIQLWEKHTSRVISGVNPIFSNIGAKVEEYDKYSRELKIYENEKNKKLNEEYKSNKEEIDARSYDFADLKEKEFQEIIIRIRHTYYSKPKENSMIEINKDEIYIKLLAALTKIIEDIKEYLAYQHRQDTLDNLNNNVIINLAEDDQEFTTMFKKIAEAYHYLFQINKYLENDNLFNKGILQEHYDSNNEVYQSLLARVNALYKEEVDPQEYENILEDLQELTTKLYTICTNEAVLLEHYKEINKQHTRIK